MSAASLPGDPDYLSPEEIQALNERRRLRWQARVNNSRLSLPIEQRLQIVTASSFIGGMVLGVAHGSKKAGLRFRAENAHRLPTTATNWYLYHKTKNYQVMWQGIKEGGRLGARITFWAAAYLGLEHALDSSWGRTDFLSSVVSSMVIAGGFSLKNKLDIITTVRTVKKGLVFGLAFGLTQDALGLIKGRPVSYIDWISSGRRHPIVDQRGSFT